LEASVLLAATKTTLMLHFVQSVARSSSSCCYYY
jgi:hypothetical protein